MNIKLLERRIISLRNFAKDQAIKTRCMQTQHHCEGQADAYKCVLALMEKYE